MAYNDFVTNIANADTDAQALSAFMQQPASAVIPRRIAGNIKPLDYYLGFFRGLELVYSQADGFVNVNGTQVKTVTQAIKDAIYNAGVANGVNANLVSYNNRTQADKNNDTVSVFDYFTKDEKSAYDANNAIDVTAAVQRAINSGKNIDLVGRTFYVNNLTQTVIGQSIISSQGITKLIKNANGAILTSTANYGFVATNTIYSGGSNTSTLTGDGLVISGNNPLVLNCGGRWINGRPLKATGNRVVVKGCCDIWQTLDTTTNGYDIEIGKSGTATLYHELDDVYTSQKQGGILLTDTGAHTIKGGQFYKLSIKAGTKPAGVNGGKTIGSRILGDITVELSSATFVANQIDPVTITFANGTSNCSLDKSNALAVGCTIVNNGNINNLIERNTATGSDGTIKLTYGADAATRTISYNPSDASKGVQYDSSVVIPNAQAYKIKNSAGAEQIVIIIAANDSITFGSLSGNYTYLYGNNLGLNTPGGTQVRVSDGLIAPFTDATKLLGSPTLRWKQGFVQDLHLFPPTSINPTVNGELVFEKTSDTTLKIKVQGSDGVVRSATLNLS